MGNIPPELIERDVVDLKKTYDQTFRDIDQTFRRLAVEASPRRRATLERRAVDLYHEARLVATAHERATRALEKAGANG